MIGRRSLSVAITAMSTLCPCCKTPNLTQSTLASSTSFTDETSYNTWIQQEVRSAQADGTSNNLRFVYLPWNFVKAGGETLDLARVGLVKALNLIAVDANEIVIPREVDGNGLLYAISLPDFFGVDADQKWNIVATAHAASGFSAAKPGLIAAFDPVLPVAADRLAYNLLHGAIYTQLIAGGMNIGTTKAPEFYAKEHIGEPTHRLLAERAITFAYRYIERRPAGDEGRSYWVTFDHFYGDPQLKPAFLKSGVVPGYRDDHVQWAGFGDEPIASEAWMHMKNGLPAWYIWGNVDQLRNCAELSFVGDPLHITAPLSSNDAKHEPKLLTGQCINCHTTGVQGNRTSVWRLLADYSASTDVISKFQGYFSTQDDLDRQYAADRARIQTAMRKIISNTSHENQAFQERILSGNDPREPVYFLIQNIVGAGNGGNTLGYRRRPSTVHNAGQLLAARTDLAAIYKSTDMSQTVNFEADIWPTLQDNCAGCHDGSDDQLLNLVSSIDKAKGYRAKIAEAVVSGFMPPSGPLSPQTRSLFIRWGSQEE